RGITAGEERIPAAARDRERIELRGLVRLLLVGTVGVKTLGAAAIDLGVQRSVRAKLVHAEERDLGIVGMPRALGWMWHHTPEAPAVGEEIGNLELLVANADDVVLEPGLIDPAESRIVDRLQVDIDHLGSDR